MMQLQKDRTAPPECCETDKVPRAKINWAVSSFPRTLAVTTEPTIRPEPCVPNDVSTRDLPFVCPVIVAVEETTDLAVKCS